jgi:prepilin-type N-terminal cleavage/methylation domain-containing protein
MFKRNQKGFTLIELMIVIAIIGILAAIIIPVVGKVRQSASSAKAIANVKQIGMANLLYAQDNKQQILGWGPNGTEPVSNAVLRNFAIYLVQQKFNNQNYQFTDRNLMNSMQDFVDPRVPAQWQRYNTVPWTYAFNRIMNYSYGRRSELEQAGLSTVGVASTARRLNEFLEPSRTLYLASGPYELQPSSFDVAPLTDPASAPARNTIPVFYFHGSNNATPAVFLDGSARMLTYPISKQLLNPRIP